MPSASSVPPPADAPREERAALLEDARRESVKWVSQREERVGEMGFTARVTVSGVRCQVSGGRPQRFYRQVSGCRVRVTFFYCQLYVRVSRWTLNVNDTINSNLSPARVHWGVDTVSDILPCRVLVSRGDRAKCQGIHGAVERRVRRLCTHTVAKR